jgi:MarR family transcriptional regulator for hemolysin
MWALHPGGSGAQNAALHNLDEFISMLMLSYVMNTDSKTQKRLDRDPLIVLSDVARILRTRADQRAREHGMTRAQWVILAKVERNSGLSQNELAALLEVEPITVGRLVDRLEARGLIERRADPGDRRIRRLHLLPAATPILKEISRCRAEINVVLTAGMPAATLTTTIDCLLQMKANLNAERREEAESA